MGPHPLLEQLVHPPVRQLPARPGEPFELEPELLSRQQGLPFVLGLRIGGDQRQRGQVIARRSWPRRPRRARRSGTAAAARAGRGAARSPPTARCRAAACPRRQPNQTRSQMTARSGQAHPADHRHGKSWCNSSSHSARCVSSRSVRHEPGPVSQAAGQRPGARRGDIAGHDVGLAGKRGEHLGVRGQQHRTERHAELGRPPPQRRQPGRRGSSPRAWRRRAPDPGSTAGSR